MTETMNGLPLVIPAEFTGRRNLSLAFRRGFSMYCLSPERKPALYGRNPSMATAYERGYAAAQQQAHRNDGAR